MILVFLCSCTIQNSIICSEAHIEDNVILKDYIVGFRCTVSCNSKSPSLAPPTKSCDLTTAEAKGETFVRESEEINL